MITIPVATSNPLFSQVTTLDGQDFILLFEWNLRESAWYLDISDQDGVPIATSRKITVGYPLITRSADIRRPLGMLMAIDTSGAGLDPGLDDFGTRVQLIYFEEADLAPQQ